MSTIRPILICLVVFAACSDRLEPRGNVIASAEGPFATALVTEDGSGGATSPWVYRVYLQDSKRAVEMMRAIKVENLDVEWMGRSQLLIRMSCGQILSFHNFHDRLDVNGDFIERIGVLLESHGPCSSHR